jgi:hypothetical protein
MGVYCLRQSYRIRPRFLPFAAIPLGFAAQQFAEAVVWNRLLNDPPLPAEGPVAIFLFFAIGWWPFWFPFCAAWAAWGTQWGRFFAAMTIASTLWFFLAYMPIFDDPACRSASVMRHSIRYAYSDRILLGNDNRFLIVFLYCFSTCCPLLLLSTRVFAAPVALALASAIVSGLTHTYAFTSVWCFFAAVLSAYCTFFFFGMKPPRPGALADSTRP